MTTEEWLDVVGYKGVYQVSSLGRVKRVAGGPGAVIGRILKPTPDRAGYLRVVLYRGGKRFRVYVHRLVLETFIGDAPSPKHEGNHKNGNKADHRVENLEWITPSENCKHAFRMLGREIIRGEAHVNAKLTRDDVIEIRRLYATGEHTQAELGKRFGVHATTIGLIIRRETWQHVS